MSDSGGGNAARIAFEASLAALRQEYAASLPGRVAQAHEQLRICRAAPDDIKPLQELHRNLHTMAGTAGTLGLVEVGERARAIEAELDRLLDASHRSAEDYDGVALKLESVAGPVGPGP